MNQKHRSHQPTLWIVLWLAFVLVACNLGTSPSAAPPTLAPRASATPPPTLGFSGLGNQPVNVQPGNVNTPVTSINVEFFNLMQQIDVSRLRLHIESLQGFTTRHVNSSQTDPNYGIGAARNYIYSQFQEIAQQSQGRFNTQLQEFDLTWDGISTRQANVVGVLNGTAQGAGFVVLGAHYDSINTDFGDAVGFAPGANDNGSGIAALIEIARVLSQRQYRASIVFVAFSAEEVNRQGSKAFVNFANSLGMDIVGMINIDSIGNSNDRNGAVEESLRIFSCETENFCTDGGLSRHMARSVEFLGFAHDATLEMKVERQGDRDGRYGDHFSFAEAGYPAIRFISTMEEFGNGSTRDTIEYVEFPYLRKTTQSIMLITVALADGPPPPRSISLRTNESGRPTLIWEAVPGARDYVIALRAPNATRYDFQLDWADGTSLTWEDLTSGKYAAVAIGTRGPNGLIGQLSPEYPLQ